MVEADSHVVWDQFNTEGPIRLSAKAQKELPLRSYPYPRYNKPQLVLYEGYVYVGREIDGCGEIFWWQHSFLGLFTQNWPKTRYFRDLSTKSPS